MRFNLSVTIQRSPEDVFRFLRDKDKYPQKKNSPVLILEQTTPSPVGVGTQLIQEESLHMKGLLKLAGPILERMLLRQLRIRLRSIKSDLEQGWTVSD